jgi:MFS family permease
MGLGAALIFPATLSLLTNVFAERRERARAIGLWGASTGVGIAVGPIVGGWLLEHFSWASVFIALVPIAALAATLVAIGVPTSRDPGAPPADRLGLVLSTAAMALLIYTIIEAPSRGWDAALSVAGFVVTAVLVALFIVHERRVGVPLLDVKLFRNLRSSAASAALTITFFSLMGFIFLITLYFQFLKGYGPLETGVRLLPVATTVGITSVLGTRIAVRSGTKLVVVAGLLSLAAGLAWEATESETTDYTTIAGAMIFIGGGIGLTSAPATESIMGAVPAAKAGSARRSTTRPGSPAPHWASRSSAASTPRSTRAGSRTSCRPRCRRAPPRGPTARWEPRSARRASLRHRGMVAWRAPFTMPPRRPSSTASRRRYSSPRASPWPGR